MKTTISLLRRLAVALLAVTGSVTPRAADAQVAAPRYYTVVNGDTLWEVARRYHVSASELAERSHLTAPYALRRGMRLRLPSRAIAVPDADPNAPPAAATTARPGATTTAPVTHPGATHPTAHPGSNATAHPTPAIDNHRAGGGRWGRPARPGVVHFKRVNDSTEIVADLRRIGPVTRQRMRAFLRANNGATHPIDARLLRQVAMFSDHFGGRTIEVISSFRPRRRGQYTAHSRHNSGHAIDFRVAGVSNRVARDYCRTFAATGCGFYPRSVFIHMDTRDESAYWVDWSRPGERPRYGSESHPPPSRPRNPPPNANPLDTPDPSVPPVGADPELDDVADDNPTVRSATPAPTEGSNDTNALPTGD